MKVVVDRASRRHSSSSRAVFGDERGFFFESWNARDFAAAGLAATFVQDNHSRSRRGVLRGLHYQVQHAQGKLVRVVVGEVFDVVVDLRRSSPTFGRSVGHDAVGAEPATCCGCRRASRTASSSLSEQRGVPLQDHRLLVSGARAHAALERPRARHRVAARRRADPDAEGRRGHAARGGRRSTRSSASMPRPTILVTGAQRPGRLRARAPARRPSAKSSPSIARSSTSPIPTRSSPRCAARDPR